MTTRALVRLLVLLALAGSPVRAQPAPERPENPLLCPVAEHPEQAVFDGAKRRRDLLLASRWVELEKELDQLRAKGRPEGETRTALELPLEWLSSDEDLAAIDSWCAASRRDWPQLVRGKVGILHAWAARGSGFASTVTDEGWRLFAERLTLAGRALEEAERRAPRCPEAPTALITVAMGSGAPEEVARAAFARAVAADRRYLPAYQAMATYLLPRWHGSPEALFEFVERSLKDDPDEPALYLLLVYAHEWVDTSDAHFLRQDVQAQVLAAYDRVVARYPRCADAWYGKAQVHERAGDQRRKYEAYCHAAELGYPRAMRAAGYHELFDTRALPAERRATAGPDGVRHLCRAASLGEAAAMEMLGKAFELDWSVPPDHASAAYWYRLAIERTADARMRDECRVRLAALVIGGFVPPPPGDEVVRNLTLAQRAGRADATAWLGRVHAEGKLVKQDVVRGVKLLEEAMQAGSTLGQAFLGRLLVEGQVVQPDVAQGTRLLNLAAARQDPEANLLLGLWARDPARGLTHLRAAYRGGHPAAGRAIREHLARNPTLPRVDGDPPAR